MHVELSQKLNKNLNYDINGMNPTFSTWTHMDSSLENEELTKLTTPRTDFGKLVYQFRKEYF